MKGYRKLPFRTAVRLGDKWVSPTGHICKATSVDVGERLHKYNWNCYRPIKPTLSKKKVRNTFYNGMEYFAAWLVDHAEGETITEELLREWAIKAWKQRNIGEAK
jgi:hypothetical protein